VGKINALLDSVLKSPIIWGGLASAGFFALLHTGPLGSPFFLRYFAGHPVNYTETVMFFVGFATLVLKAFDVLRQYPGLAESPLGPAGPVTHGGDQCSALLARLARLPAYRQGEYFVRRLRDALLFVRRQGSAKGLGEELKYLADLDVARVHGSYGLFRLVIWAIPILGFLGTVIGITIAIANLTPKTIQENSLTEVTAGLGVAFDTTTLALSLSIVLMLVQFLTDRAETRLLAAVDERVAEELEGRFEQIASGPDGQVAALRRMTEVLVQATERLVQRQAELWRESMEAAAARWTQMADTAAEQLHRGLAAALDESLKTHAQQLVAAEQAAAAENRRHWETLQQTQVQNSEALASLQTGMVRQAEVLARAVEATGDVAGLQDALNRNLASLAGSRNFEQTVMSLAAAIHLLNARLAEEPGRPSVQLDSTRRKSVAA